MIKFADLVRGDTRRYRISWPTEDLTGATGKMTWRLTLTDADPGALQINGVLAPADTDGEIHSIYFDLLKASSAALSLVLYPVDFEIIREAGVNVKTIRGQVHVIGGGG